jgi:hypothetical protein
MAEKHWTIVLQVKEVTEADVVRDSSGYPVKTTGVGGGGFQKTDRQVLDRLSIVVSAGNEAEAYKKAIALLEVNAPAPETWIPAGAEARPLGTGDDAAPL